MIRSMRCVIHARNSAVGRGFRLVSSLVLAATLGIDTGHAQEIDDWSWSTAARLSGAPRDLAVLVEEDGWRQYVVSLQPSQAEYLVGLYHTLRQFKVNGGVRNTLQDFGAFIRTRYDVTYCPAISHTKDRLAAYNQNWSCWGVMTSGFYLKQREAFSLEFDGGEASIIDGVRTSGLWRKFEVVFEWKATEKLLIVTIFDFMDPLETGPQEMQCGYCVRGQSVLTTRSNSFLVDSKYSQKKTGEGQTPHEEFELSAKTARVDTKTRFSVTIKGNEAYAAFGFFSAIERVLGDGTARVEFGLSSSWITDEQVDYEEVGFVDEVTGVQMIAWHVSLAEKLFGGGFSDSGTFTARQNQLPIAIHWWAAPARDVTNEEDEGLGSKIRFVVDKAENGKTTSYYQPRFRSFLDWALNVHTTTTGTPGFHIDVAAAGLGEKEAKKAYVRTF